MISGIFRNYYCRIFCYCSKHYIFKKYVLRVDCPFNRPKIGFKKAHANPCCQQGPGVGGTDGFSGSTSALAVANSS